MASPSAEVAPRWLRRFDIADSAHSETRHRRRRCFRIAHRLLMPSNWEEISGWKGWYEQCSAKLRPMKQSYEA